MNITLFFAAMWVSEIWYSRYQRIGCNYARARGIVIHDRILNGRIPVLPIDIVNGLTYNRVSGGVVSV